MTTAIVVAAGLSKRMGAKNKLLLNYQGKAILLHSIDALEKSEVENITVVTGFEKEKIEHLLINKNIQLLHNPDFRNGLTSSIQTGLKGINKKEQDFLICLGDMPLVKTEHINRILSKRSLIGQKEIVAPLINGKRSHPLLFSWHFRERVLSHKSKDGCKELVQENIASIKFCSFENDFSFDIDNPADYNLLNERN